MFQDSVKCHFNYCYQSKEHNNVADGEYDFYICIVGSIENSTLIVNLRKSEERLSSSLKTEQGLMSPYNRETRVFRNIIVELCEYGNEFPMKGQYMSWREIWLPVESSISYPFRKPVSFCRA